MKKIIPLLFVVAVGTILFNQVDNANAQDLTGEDFLKMSENYQTAWVSGFWDGAMVCCEVEEANDEKCRFRDLMKVMDGIKYHKITELLNKYLKDNPDKTHKPLGFLFYKCIEDAAK